MSAVAKVLIDHSAFVAGWLEREMTLCVLECAPGGALRSCSRGCLIAAGYGSDTPRLELSDLFEATDGGPLLVAELPAQASATHLARFIADGSLWVCLIVAVESGFLVLGQRREHADDATMGALVSHLAASQQRAHVAHRAAVQQARRDTLTGLANRHGLRERFAVQAQRVSAASPLALIMADIDRFKHINDTYGHLVGDRVLVRLSALLVGALRGDDLAVRWGGEEFVLLLPDTGTTSAMLVAQRLCELVADMELDGVPERITVSLGVAVWRPGDDLSLLVARADQALYRAKRAGRNQVVLEDAPEHP